MLNLFNMSMSSWIHILQSLGISTALGVLSGNVEISSSSTIVSSSRYWAPGHGDHPVASSRSPDQRQRRPDDRKYWAGGVVLSGDVDWQSVDVWDWCAAIHQVHGYLWEFQQILPYTWWWITTKAGSHRQTGFVLRAVLVVPGSTLFRMMTMLICCQFYGEPRLPGVMEWWNGPYGLCDNDYDDDIKSHKTNKVITTILKIYTYFYTATDHNFHHNQQAWFNVEI